MHKLCRDNGRWAFLLIASLLAGCAAPPDAASLARHHAIPLSQVQAGGFRLPVLGTLTTASGELRVYLPGDGIPWRGHRPGKNPTGRRHMALELLLRDPAPAVLLGRPCYLQRQMDPACDPDLWTGGRYSETVVSALDAGLQQLVARSGAQSLLLVGYSGGGTLATLLAARQRLPTTVVTIAANLDTAAWTRYHRHLPLSASLNPARETDSEAPLHRIHLHGDRDKVVPLDTLDAYRKHHPDAGWLIQAGFDHRCCWVEAWPELLETAREVRADRPDPRAPPGATRARP